MKYFKGSYDSMEYLKKEYKNLCKKWHPDFNNRTTKEFQELQNF